MKNWSNRIYNIFLKKLSDITIFVAVISISQCCVSSWYQIPLTIDEKQKILEVNNLK